eukprot:3715583-Prymnesium_polylepis.1
MTYCHIGDQTKDSAVIRRSGEGSRAVLGSIPSGVPTAGEYAAMKRGRGTAWRPSPSLAASAPCAL